MKKFALPITLAMAAASALPVMAAGTVFNLPMDLTGSTAKESVKGTAFNVQANIAPMQITGADGKAWRTDGYTTSMTGNVGNLLDSQKMSASVAFAIDTNVIIGADQADANNYNARFVDCINGNTGFAFLLGRSGQFEFQVYVGGQLVSIKSDVNTAAGKLQLWQWYNLTGTVDGNKVTLYLNGSKVGEKTASGTGVKVSGNMTLGRDNTNNNVWATARVGDFNGAIDYLRITDDATVQTYTSRYADLNVPADRYKNDRDRAVYHAQPGLNWTNETHGFLYNPADGKYHVISQRTGSAPVMSHAHYGHYVSSDLVNWRDDKPMIWPSENYDRRGCWSGCLFTDSKINGGKPVIIYTGVEYGETSHAAVAYCDDATNLRTWRKLSNNPVSTYNNVARDTYFFRVDDNNAYFIIGDDGYMRKYKYNGNDTWSDAGTFYSLTANGESGFTEMPNVSKLSNGKWLMTYTPWSQNVQCKYRIGEIGADGTFKNFGASQLFDCMAMYGFALMSPSIGTDKDGKLVAMGIVADKQATEWNISKGYAHLFSFPRRIDVDAQGNLVQSIHPDVLKLRNTAADKSFKKVNETLSGTMNVHPVRGRQAEICATFKVGTSAFGFNFCKNAKGKGGTVKYNPANHTVSIDVTNLVSGDYGMKTNSYQLPIYPKAGEDMKLQMFVDHSCVDLFINDRYATSFRIFIGDNMSYDTWEVFADGETTVKSVEAYMLGDGDCSVTPNVPHEFKLPENNGKVAFVKASDASQQETAAANFFTSKLKNSNVIAAGNAALVDRSKFDCIWIHIDRMNAARGELPSAYNEAYLTALKNYLAAGGNLYLTGQATQLVARLGRTGSAYAPNEYNSGNGGNGDDEWTVNPIAKGHKLFADLEESEAFGYTTYGLLYGGGGGSAIHREDHNCMWRLDELNYSVSGADPYAKFEAQTLSKVLGTWGQETTKTWAGMIEFYPTEKDGKKSGTIIANGLAACQWYVDNGSNACEQNLQLLTANALAYMAAKDGNTPDNPGGEVPDTPKEPEPEVLETTGKVALYVGFESEAALQASTAKEEKAAYALFREQFPAGTVIFSGNASAISAADYDMLWVMCDRMNAAQGWTNLPDEYKNSTFVNVLKNFVAGGGNLLLTKQASQLVNAIGRTTAEPGEFSAGDGGWGTDMWQVNVNANGTDWSVHPVFSGLAVENAGHGKLIDMLGGGGVHREDHNCMWKLNDFGGHDAFCTAHNAAVLGTWGHNGGQAWGGLIEFYPAQPANAPARATDADQVARRKGTVMAVGLAAYELAPRSGENTAHSNLVTMTSNMIKYLSPVEAVNTVVDEVFGLDEGEPVYFNLQGQRVANPGAGIYIEVRGRHARKITL